MNQLQVAGMQTDATVGIAALVAVFEVALNRTADGGQLGPYLMMPSGKKFHFQQGVVFRTPQYMVKKFGFLSTWPSGLAGIGFILFFVLVQTVCQFSLGNLRAVPCQGPINLRQFPLADKFVGSFQGLAGFGKQQSAAYRTVETVRHTQKNVAGLLIPLFDKIFETLYERTVAGSVALHDLPSLFVDNQQMIVFVEIGSRFGHIRG